MLRLVLSMLIVAALAPVPALAAAAISNPSSASSGAAADLIRRIERDLDRLTRGLDSDVAYIEKRRQPAATPAAGSPRLMRQ